MAFTAGSYILASDFVALKARVKAEMLRRNGNIDVSSYASTTYDYTQTPTSGSGMVLEEHIDKVRDILANINPVNLPAQKSQGDIITDIKIIDSTLTTFEAQPRSATSNSDCASSCTGMCVTQCTTTCTGGCSGGCSSCSGCSGCSSCSGGCSGCSGGCSTACSGCTGGCSSCSGCYGCSSCLGSCTSCAGCSGSCYSSCGGGCGSGCSNICTGGNF